MRAKCYLVLNSRGVVRAVKGKPVLDRGEFAVWIRIDVPSEVFAPEIPAADITIAPRDAIYPVVTVETPQTPGSPETQRTTT